MSFLAGISMANKCRWIWTISLILAPLDIKGSIHCYFGLEATSPNCSSVFPRQPAVETELEASGGGEDTPALYHSLPPSSSAQIRSCSRCAGSRRRCYRTPQDLETGNVYRYFGIIFYMSSRRTPLSPLEVIFMFGNGPASHRGQVAWLW